MGNEKKKKIMLSVKQSLVIRCMQIAIEKAEKTIKKPNCSFAELLDVVNRLYPDAFDLTGSTGTNPLSTLVTSKLMQATHYTPMLAKQGVKRTCTVCDEYKVTYRLILPDGIVFASDKSMTEARPRVTQKKTGRKGVGAGTPDGRSNYWTHGDVDFRPLIAGNTLNNQQRQALWAFLHCLKNGNLKPTSDDVGDKMASKFRAQQGAGRKRMPDLERDFCAVHAVKPLEGGPQYWVAGPAEGKTMQTNFVRKRDQENRLKRRLYELMAGTIPRLRWDAERNAMILGVKIDSVKMLTIGVSGPYLRKEIKEKLFTVEHEALKEIRAKLRKDGKIDEFGKATNGTD